MYAQLITLAEQGYLPDLLVRRGIRSLLRERAGSSSANDDKETQRFARQMKDDELLQAASDANQQHYEVPTAFFQRVLGKRLKYSCGYWEDEATSLDRSEEAMLELTCRRAEVENGMTILDLGCGWGSLTLWLAEKYPECKVVSVSNSSTQRAFIEQRCRERGFGNVQVLTRNVVEFQPELAFDRVISVEMFEHVRNYQQLLANIAGWLLTDGKLFVHIFCHHNQPYKFENNGPKDWMTRHFFTGGIMPSFMLLNEFNDHLTIEDYWQINGLHYSKTCEAWLKNADLGRHELLKILATASAADRPSVLLQRWRMFFMACSELFRYGGGEEWFVGHYLLSHVHQQSQPRLLASASDSRL